MTSASGKFNYYYYRKYYRLSPSFRGIQDLAHREFTTQVSVHKVTQGDMI